MAHTKKHDLKQPKPCAKPPQLTPDVAAPAATTPQDAIPDADVFAPDSYAVCDGLGACLVYSAQLMDGDPAALSLTESKFLRSGCGAAKFYAEDWQKLLELIGKWSTL